MFVNRVPELASLEAEYAKPGSSLVVVYGRRRLGKTTLLREFIRGKPALYYLATEENESENRKAFQHVVAGFSSNPLLHAASVDRWEPLFQQIACEARNRKVVVVLDEFQYLGKANSAFPSILQRIWDMDLQQSNIMLILCGSLVHMMESQVLSYTSPLYGRRTSQIRLGAIPFEHFSSFYPDASQAELLPLYAVTGGVPKYIELFQPRSDIYNMMANLVLSPKSFLFDEPSFLLGGEVRDIGPYFSIVKTIAAGERKLGAIASALGVQQTSLSAYLRTLSNLDLVHREVPVTEKQPHKSKRGLYRISDNFLRFWFRFVYPYRSMLEGGQEAAVMDVIRRDFTAGHVSWVYEDVCRERALRLCAGGMWPLRLERVGRWWNDRSEVDIVGLGENSVLYGECKYWSHPVGMNVLEKLRSKAADVFPDTHGRDEYFALFSASGFTPDLLDLAKRDSHILLSTWGEHEQRISSQTAAPVMA